MKALVKTFAAISLAFMSAGCASTMEDLKTAGKAPEMTPIQDPQMAAAGRRQVVLQMPQDDNRSSSNSLWQSGAKQFFSDPRASKIGDILTVNITIDDSASLNNSSSGTRKSERSGGVSKFFGLESLAGKVLPSGYDPSNMVGASSSGTFSGDGSVSRKEKISLTVAALVTQVLPNGNLIVAGRQEVRVNNELRELLVSGIVRPQDITSSNTVQHTQMAEARISYGGRGQLSRYQKQPVGQAIIDSVSPF